MKLSWSWETVTGIGTIISAVGTIIAVLKPAGVQFPILPEHMGAPVYWFAAVVLFAGSLILTIRARRKRSLLLRPEALRLDPRDPKHLIGRDEEVAQLTDTCLDHSLVFLTGESGAGKSALVRAGLIPALRNQRRLLPLYIDVWGQDWERGPVGALADAFWHSLEARQRKALDLDRRPEAPHVFEALREAHPRLGLTPLLVFDQFDDYQARHRERFLQRRTWLPAATLIQQNAFWKSIADLLEDEAVHCLFVTRADAADGLESVRFCRPSAFRLDRLRSVFIGLILDRLTSPADDKEPAVANPERDWAQLKIQLERDLDQEGAVLPQRVKTVLAGLMALKYLTVREYRRYGRVPGLEALHVEHHIRAVARTMSLQPTTIRRLLLAMIDPETRAKTVAKTLTELVAASSDDRPKAKNARLDDTSWLEAALDELTKAELVRERIDPDTQRRSWLLDHDYLTRPVIEAERRANRWAMLLEEGAKAYEESGGSWKALLGVWTQIRLGFARLGGSFRYGRHRRYALMSMKRFVPVVGPPLVVILIAFSIAKIVGPVRHAEAIWDGLGARTGTDIIAETESLWDLATANDAVRQGFLEKMLANPKPAQRFTENASPIVRALVGLDDKRRESIAQQAGKTGGKVVKNTKNAAAPIIAPIIIEALNSLQTELRLEESLLLKAETQPMAAEVLSFVERTAEPRALPPLVQALVALKPSPEQAKSAAERIMSDLKTKSDPNALLALAQALAALESKLPPGKTQPMAAEVLVLLERMADPRALPSLVQALVALKPSDEQATTAAKKILSDLHKQSDSYTLSVLAQALAALESKLPPGKTQPMAAEVLALVERTAEPWALPPLVQALVALKPSDEQATTAAKKILSDLERTAEPWALPPLVQALVALKPSPGQARTVAEKVQKAMQGSLEAKRWELLQNLAGAIGMLGAKLEPGQAANQAAEITKKLLAILNQNHLVWVQMSLANAIQTLEPRSQPEEARILLARMDGTGDPLLRLPCLVALSRLELSPEQAEKVAGAVRTMIAFVGLAENGLFAAEAAKVLVGIRKSLSEDEFKEIVFEVLKYPTAAGEATKVLLEALENIAPTSSGQSQPQFNGNLWKAVEIAKQNWPDIDLESPPKDLPTLLEHQAPITP